MCYPGFIFVRLLRHLVRWPSHRQRLILSTCLGIILSAGVAARAEDVEAVSSKLSNGYKRTVLPDGSVKPETYAFGKGDKWGGTRADGSLDNVDFMQVAKTVAGPLADQGYFPTRDAKTTNLLIMVYWGSTMAPEQASHSGAHVNMSISDQKVDRAMENQSDVLRNPGSKPGDIRLAREELAAATDTMNTALIAVEAENRMREDVDRKNATMLGYDSLWLATFDAQTRTARGLAREDMMTELEENRYFVVLMAFDFQQMAKQKKSKLLWEARMSVREHDHRFDSALAPMVTVAAAYFGRDSNGLKHKDLPAGKVDVGQVTNLGVVPAPK